MDGIPEITPLQQQITRERHREREQLSDGLTALKSLLRLDADGIGDQEDLLDVLDQTRQIIDRFSCTVQRESLNLDCPGATTPPPPPPPAAAVATAIGTFKLETSDNADPFDSPCSVLEGSAGGSSRLRSLSESSTRSSWRSSTSGVSTAATSISPRDSLLGGCRLTSPLVFGSPPLCATRFREDEFRFINEMENSIEEESDDDDDDGEPDPSDASFQRLSSILASLQQQAEAAVCSPPVEEDSESPISFSGDYGPTRIAVGGDILPTSTKTVTYESSSQLVSSTPKLDSTKKASTTSILSFSKPPLPKKIDGGELQMLLPPFSPTAPRNSLSWAPDTPGMMWQRRERRPSSEGCENTESRSLELDLERLLVEFLDEGVYRAHGEHDVMFRWVWIYMVGGGFLWAIVGWVLRWGCACGESPALCRQ